MDTKNLLEKFSNLYYSTQILTCYHDVLDNPVGRALQQLLKAMAENDTSQPTMILAYADLYRELADAEPSCSLSTFLLKGILASVNPFSRAPRDMGSSLSSAVLIDIETIQRLASLAPDGLRDEIRRRYIVADEDEFLNLVGHLPLYRGDCFEPGDLDLGTPRSAWKLMFRSLKYALENKRLMSCVSQLAEFYLKYGAGHWNLYYAYDYRNGAISPIKRLKLPEPDELIDYTGNLAKIYTEVESFLQGERRQHVLLTGARGTGKSTAIHSVLARYAKDGIMLVSLRKEDLRNLEDLFQQLYDCPQKVILFFDDLSFDRLDDDYRRLKAFLEGEVRQMPEHCAIYVTSNRRHLIREDDTEANYRYSGDERDERLSLASRFGLQLHFAHPIQTDYLAVVEHLILQRRYPWNDEVRQAALGYAARKGHRSPRTAQQFVAVWPQLEGDLCQPK